MQANVTINVVADSAGSRTQQCHDYALFFRHLPVLCSIFVFPACFVLSIAFTTWLGKMTTPSDKPAILPATAPPEATVIPSPSDADLPPPYQSTSTNPTTNSILPPTAGEAGEVPKKRTSAELFVSGSTLFACIILLHIFSALAIQTLIFCSHGDPVPLGIRIFLWFAYSVPTIYATSAAACWLVLFRNLWGPRIIKKYPIDTNNVPALILGIAISPLVGVFLALRHLARFVAGGAVFVVESCQRRLCGDALEDELEVVQEDVELEAGGTFSVEDDENEELEVSGQAEERQGLMKAFGNV